MQVFNDCVAVEVVQMFCQKHGGHGLCTIFGSLSLPGLRNKSSWGLGVEATLDDAYEYRN